VFDYILLIFYSSSSGGGSGSSSNLHMLILKWIKAELNFQLFLQVPNILSP